MMILLRGGQSATKNRTRQQRHSSYQPGEERGGPARRGEGWRGGDLPRWGEHSAAAVRAEAFDHEGHDGLMY